MNINNHYNYSLIAYHTVHFWPSAEVAVASHAFSKSLPNAQYVDLAGNFTTATRLSRLFGALKTRAYVVSRAKRAMMKARGAILSREWLLSVNKSKVREIQKKLQEYTIILSSA